VCPEVGWVGAWRPERSSGTSFRLESGAPCRRSCKQGGPGDASDRGGAASAALTNWAGDLTYSADSIHHPTSVAKVQQLVANIRGSKTLGTRHSSV
jgi:hypothetical protein